MKGKLARARPLFHADEHSLPVPLGAIAAQRNEGPAGFAIQRAAAAALLPTQRPPGSKKAASAPGAAGAAREDPPARPARCAALALEQGAMSRLSSPVSGLKQRCLA